MIPEPTNKSKKNDAATKSHVSVSDATVPDSIVPTIIEPSSLAADFAGMRYIMTRLESKIDDYITRLTILEPKLVASPDLQQTSDSLLLSLPDEVQHFSTHLTHCELNHDTEIQTFYNYKKDVHDFLGMGTPSYMNSSNLPSPFQDHNVPMSFRMVLEKIGNPLDLLSNDHLQTFLTQYNKWLHYRDLGGYLSLYGYVQMFAVVYDLYLRKAKSQGPSFQFAITDNSFFSLNFWTIFSFLMVSILLLSTC